ASTIDRDDADVVLHSPALRAHERDRLSIGRPRGQAALRETGSKRTGRPVGDREQKQCRIRVVTDFGILCGVLLVHDGLAVPRPGGGSLSQLALGLLAPGGAGDRHEVQWAGTAELAGGEVAGPIVVEGARPARSTV